MINQLGSNRYKIKIQKLKPTDNNSIQIPDPKVLQIPNRTQYLQITQAAV